MLSLYATASVAALMASQCLASPVGVPVLPRIGVPGVNVSLPVTKRSYSPDILGTLNAPYHKFGFVMPEHRLMARGAGVERVWNPSQEGSGVTTPAAVDVEYFTPFTIQGTEFNMLLDTGSSDTWVFSDLMPSSMQAGHQIFNTSAATQIPGETFSVTYGDSSTAQGSVYQSTMSLGNVVVPNAAIEAASSVSSGFSGATGLDGLIGLAFPKLNAATPKRVFSFFSRARRHLEQPLFAVTLKHQAPGSIDFGFIDPAKYQGAITYADCTKYYNEHLYWQFTADSTSLPNTTSYSAIVDTGTSLMYVPQTLVDELYDSIPGAGYDPSWAAYVFPCDADVPDFSVYLNGVALTVPAANINWEQLNATTCLGGIQSSAQMPFSILGAVFLKDLYVVFERAKGVVPRLGFAQQA